VAFRRVRGKAAFETQSLRVSHSSYVRYRTVRCSEVCLNKLARTLTRRRILCSHHNSALGHSVRSEKPFVVISPPKHRLILAKQNCRRALEVAALEVVGGALPASLQNHLVKSDAPIFDKATYMYQQSPINTLAGEALPHTTLRVGGTAVALLGIIVLIGLECSLDSNTGNGFRYGRDEFNTALCLILCGIGAILLTRDSQGSRAYLAALWRSWVS